MSLLNWPTEKVTFDRRAHQQRRRLVLQLFARFGDAFPEITYQLDWKSPTINSQAWRFGSKPYVRVYGGLVRHPTMTRSGLALMLAHETGHHLGGPPYDPAMPWISWQGQADYWAAGEGMRKVFGVRASSLTVRGAQEIYDLHKAFESGLQNDELELAADCRHEIFMAAVAGQMLPECAKEALSGLCAPSS